MPVDPKASTKDKMIALGAVAFLIVGFIVIYIIYQVTSPKPGAGQDESSTPAASVPARGGAGGGGGEE